MFSTHGGDFYVSSIGGTIQKVALLVFIITSKKFLGSYQHFVEKYSVSCVQMKKNGITAIRSWYKDHYYVCHTMELYTI